MQREVLCWERANAALASITQPCVWTVYSPPHSTTQLWTQNCPTMVGQALDDKSFTSLTTPSSQCSKALGLDVSLAIYNVTQFHAQFTVLQIFKGGRIL